MLSLAVIYWLVRAVYATRYKPKFWRHVHASSMGAVFIAIIIAGVGVLVRKIILPGDVTVGYIASAITAIPAIYFLNKKTETIR